VAKETKSSKAPVSDLIVYKANELTVSRYKLTEQETKLILYGVACLNPLKDGMSKEDRTVKISYKDYAKFMEIPESLAWTNLNNVARNLIHRVIEINLFENEQSKVKLFHWVNSVTYSDVEQSLELVFSDELKPYLFQLKRFVKYSLENVKNFSNRYSMQVYEWFLKELGERQVRAATITISPDDFRFMLMVDGENSSYQDFRALRRHIIEKVIEDINNFSDISVQFSTKGRPVRELIFEISNESSNFNSLILNDGDEIVINDEKVSKPRKRQPKGDALTYALLKVVLTQHNEQLITLSKKELAFIPKMLVFFDKNKDYKKLSEGQRTFIDGIIYKYRPKL
jgi:plasmid replication initiation protein